MQARKNPPHVVLPNGQVKTWSKKDYSLKGRHDWLDQFEGVGPLEADLILHDQLEDKLILIDYASRCGD